MAASAGVLAVAGAWYGAGLKEKQEKKQKVEARREATPADKIAILEQTRSALMAKKAGLETKIAEVEARKSRPEGQKSMNVGQGRHF
ncbi:hypothetical protein OEA41_005439 [Lepraria neglecta]|uniref:Uncharacterized protein n=1 Tax=Lepraria neglecta TaxID=209136 RepID=A0AAD9YZV9_9LECA|nr:hypothetical protein OEA41_005439 [Lepraria neglecta]